MTGKKIICSNLKCKYMSDKGICQAKKIELSLNGVHTKHQGYQDFLKCKTFKIDDEYEQLVKTVEEILKDELKKEI